MEDKFQPVTDFISSFEEVIISFYGGTDSSLLLKLSIDALSRKNVHPVFVDNGAIPKRVFFYLNEMSNFFGIELQQKNLIF